MNNWCRGGWIDTSWTLPPEAKAQLAAIYPPEALSAVEHACALYLAMSQNEEARPSTPEDGEDLLLIAETAEKLARLLNRRHHGSALERLKLHQVGQWKRGMPTKGLSMGRMDGLVADLRFLASAARDTPAAKEKGKKGRPSGTKKEAQRHLAFRLWDTYRRYHGATPKRSVDGEEQGPMARAMKVLGPLLGIGSTLDTVFREIDKASRAMDNKSQPD